MIQLERVFVDRGSDGSERDLKLVDFLFYLIADEAHHRGEMVALLWKADIEPARMEFLYYADRLGVLGGRYGYDADRW